MCALCTRRERLNRERFGGERNHVLARDGKQCQGCGELEERLLLVHHRKPGRNHRRLLVTLCRRCHVKVHRTWRPRFGFGGLLRELWREAHPDLAEQREFAFTGATRSAGVPEVQAPLFDAA